MRDQLDHIAERRPRPRVLLVDRDTSEAGRVSRFLEGEGFEVAWARTGEQAFNVLDDLAVDAIVTELQSAVVDGMRLMHIALRRDPEACLVLIAEPGSVAVATQAMLEGAYDYQVRPLNLEKILAVLNRARRVRELVEQVNELNRRLDKKYGLRGIIGNSAAISAVLARTLQVAPNDVTVLITGETGTGKELVGTALHQNSPRRNGPLIKLHCGDLSEGLIESELFGHEKGAFTGAVSARKGRFELADGGTLFLDEVSELAPGTQVKLLRVLQDGEFMRVGGDRPVRVDVRLVAATNQDLKARVKDGRFRQDLYYRLNVVSIEMPALRHRPQDIPLLADQFLREAATAYGHRVAGFTPKALGRMWRYPWPGNVRELKNVVTGMVITGVDGRFLDVEDLPMALRQVPEESRGLSIQVGSSWADAERRLIEATVQSMAGDVRECSRVLGISPRTLYRRLAQYKSADMD
jgi:DNA-binding NtrC family response regulator